MSSSTDAPHILLVEDDNIEADLIRGYVGDSPFAGAPITHVTRVGEGLAALRGERFDIVLLDLNLPDGSGIDNLHRLRKIDDSVPVIILTNIDDDNIALEAVSEGAQDYLIKGALNGDTLVRSIRYARARHAVETSLRRSEERFALAVAGARDGIWDWDLETDTVYYSPRWLAMLGLEAGDAPPVPDTWLDRVHDDDRTTLHKALQNHLDGISAHFEHEFRMRDQYGEQIWVLARGVAVRRTGDNHPTRIAGSLSNITDRKRSEELLVHEALHDALTGLPNRNLFLDRLDLALKQHRRDQARKFAVLFLDLDRFKAINDSLGHATGDRLLIEFGQRLAMFLRPGDSIARLGGDEFAILLMEISGLGEATRVAERVHDLLAQKFVIDDKELFASASIGIALSDIKYERSDDMLRDADLAMYRTKRKQRGSYSVFDNLMHETALQRLELETDLRSALKKGELAVYYQPIVSLRQMRVVGFEALMRWFHPVRGLIAPEDFIPLAEESGTIGMLTWWIMREACAQVRAWQESHESLKNLSISVNVSSRLFSEPNFAERTLALLEQTRLKANFLHLEITENAMLQHETETIRELSRLQDVGVKLHLDDFGTGYSSLTYLNQFTYDTIKIDRSFVASSDTYQDRRIVDALIGLGRVLNMSVIAEGVETQEQAQKLRDLDCRLAQGFWFSKPLPAESAQALLVRETDLSKSPIRNVSRH
ncbi:MAG: EAL domain-containing response regulator [Gammaproteobacteria bacterium]